MLEQLSASCRLEVFHGILSLPPPTDVNRKCWCVTTKGMHAVGQAEVVVLLQCLPDEKSIPRDIFSHFVQLYREALTGERGVWLPALHCSSDDLAGFIGHNERTKVHFYEEIRWWFSWDYVILRIK